MNHLRPVPHEHLWRALYNGLLQCRCGRTITVQQWIEGYK